MIRNVPHVPASALTIKGVEALKEPGPIGRKESSPGITWVEGTTMVWEVRLPVKKDAVGCKA